MIDVGKFISLQREQPIHCEQPVAGGANDRQRSLKFMGERIEDGIAKLLGAAFGHGSAFAFK